jgi:hypothetical protein
MDLNKHMGSGNTDLEEHLTCHVLDTWMFLMHEFIEFLHNCFQELVVTTQETRKLTNNMHDVCCHLSLVVLSLLLLDKIQ